MQDLMKNKKGLIMGVANEKSIAWGIAKALHASGAELAFTYQGDAFGKRAKPLAESVGSKLILDCDASNEDNLDSVFSTIEDKWGGLDFIVHAVAYSNKDELQGRYVDTTLDNFYFLLLVHIGDAPRAPVDERGWFCFDADLLRRRESYAQLQRDGRGQGGA